MRHLPLITSLPLMMRAMCIVCQQQARKCVAHPLESSHAPERHRSAATIAGFPRCAHRCIAPLHGLATGQPRLLSHSRLWGPIIHCVAVGIVGCSFEQNARWGAMTPGLWAALTVDNVRFAPCGTNRGRDQAPATTLLTWPRGTTESR